MRPKNAPILQKMTECHSTLIFMKRIANDADTMPRIKNERVLSRHKISPSKHFKFVKILVLLKRFIDLFISNVKLSIYLNFNIRMIIRTITKFDIINVICASLKFNKQQTDFCKVYVRLPSLRAILKYHFVQKCIHIKQNNFDNIHYFSLSISNRGIASAGLTSAKKWNILLQGG